MGSTRFVQPPPRPCHRTRRDSLDSVRGAHGVAHAPSRQNDSSVAPSRVRTTHDRPTDESVPRTTTGRPTDGPTTGRATTDGGDRRSMRHGGVSAERGPCGHGSQPPCPHQIPTARARARPPAGDDQREGAELRLLVLRPRGGADLHSGLVPPLSARARERPRPRQRHWEPGSGRPGAQLRTRQLKKVRGWDMAPMAGEDQQRLCGLEAERHTATGPKRTWARHGDAGGQHGALGLGLVAASRPGPECKRDGAVIKGTRTRFEARRDDRRKIGRGRGFAPTE